jgi:predicted TIM-barrel fold metal-dependent hydrolase
MSRRAAIIFGLAAAVAARAQEATMSFKDYDPQSTLVVQQHPTPRAKYPFIDIHNHQEHDVDAPEAAGIVRAMDAMNMAVMVNLSGGSGDFLQRRMAMLNGRYPTRFVTFANIDFHGIDEPAFGERAARKLEQDVRNGAQGLKIFKDLGMFVKDSAGRRVHTDDPRLDPIWEKAGELGIPVLIHTGEPASFWLPVDRHNERWLELTELPERRRSDPKFASYEQTMEEQHNLFRKHPRTKFIAAHLDWLGNDLARLGKLLDELPNVYTEIAAVLYELGRQPRAAREFLIKYQDRVMIGKDTWAPDEYPVYFRVLETDDEYFDYYRKRHAFWKMYGLALPDEVLRKIYYKNALNLLPGIDRRLFPSDSGQAH